MNECKFNHLRLINYADRTEKDIEFEKVGNSCMMLVDTDRLLYLREKKYKKIYLAKLLPESCSTKNNVIIAIYKN